MRLIAVFLLSALSMAISAADYDTNQPFGFCTRASRTDAASTYDVTGGGCYSYPVPDSFTGKVVVLKSNGEDMRQTIEDAVRLYDVVILDGSNGDFIVSSNVGVSASDKTLLGINNARIRTQWFVTDEIRAMLDAAGVPHMSTSGGGGTLPNGHRVREEAEYITRKMIIEMTGDLNENYRNSGILSLRNCQNIIIRNITFIGPGSIDVGGNDLLSCVNRTRNCWIDHCAFMDGMDGNFDITGMSDFITVSWCTFSYTEHSYMHQNTNLVGYSDREVTGYLNTTFAFNWWGTGCKQRMPMARVGKIHMLNNYFSSTTANNCINPRVNSEFLIEGNYVKKGVRHYYRQSGAIAVTWTADNYIAEASSLPTSVGATVTVPYDYSVVPYSDVPKMVKKGAGATLFTKH
jgi:pectate lyase